MAKPNESKSLRIVNPRAIAKVHADDASAAVKAFASACECSEADAKEKLILQGYRKILATTKWARENPSDPKPKKADKKVAKKVVKKVKKADPVASIVSA